MALLAIEGHKKLESAQQELFDAFSACYRTVNGRQVDTFQPHEMIMLCNEACFCDLIEQVRAEIEMLSGDETGMVKTTHDVISLAETRMLHMDEELTAELLKDPVHRTELLGELLADLQACRIVSNRFCVQDLTLEMTSKVEEAKGMVTDLSDAVGIKVTPARSGAYVGKGAKGGKGKSSAGGDEKVQALQRIADAVDADDELLSGPFDNLLYPYWALSAQQETMVNQLIGIFNREYTTRRKVLTRRLDVTIQAFLWSPKADKYMEEFSQAIAAVMDWRDKLGAANISLWNMFAADYSACEDKGKVSTSTLDSVVKKVVIPAVPDRGGVPEGYTVEDITKDVVKANVALKVKDHGSAFGKGASAQAAAAMASKRWLGKGMGVGSDNVPDNSGGKGQGGGGAYYSKGGGKKGDKGNKGDKGDKGGGGGGYYSQGGSGGYYAQQGGGSGGGGYYSKGGSGDGGGNKGGGGGGYYAQQSSGGSGGGGGFYAQQNSGGSGGGFYAQQQQGGGSFYAQQSSGGGDGGTKGGEGARGGFYAQQGGGSGGGGGFYAQQGGGGGGFYSQQGGGGGGGFYAQQSSDGGGGGFYAQQQGGGGGGYYAQQQNQGGGGGWGGRNSDRPPTAKGWKGSKK